MKCLGKLLFLLLSSACAALQASPVFASACNYPPQVHFVTPGSPEIDLERTRHAFANLLGRSSYGVPFVGRRKAIVPFGPRPPAPSTVSPDVRAYVVTLEVEESFGPVLPPELRYFVYVRPPWPMTVQTNERADRMVEQEYMARALFFHPDTRWKDLGDRSMRRALGGFPEQVIEDARAQSFDGVFGAGRCLGDISLAAGSLEYEFVVRELRGRRANAGNGHDN